MTQKASEKIIDALSQLIEGYAELQKHLSKELKGTRTEDEDEDESSDEDEGTSEEFDEALVTEVRTCLESSLEAADVSPEEFASILSAMTEALEEIDPDVFREQETQSVTEEEEDDSDDDDDIDLDEDEDFEFDEDEEEEDEDDK